MDELMSESYGVGAVCPAGDCSISDFVTGVVGGVATLGAVGMAQGVAELCGSRSNVHSLTSTILFSNFSRCVAHSLFS